MNVSHWAEKLKTILVKTQTEYMDCSVQDCSIWRYCSLVLSHRHTLNLLITPSIIAPGVILYMRTANERWHYNAMSPLIGWTYTQIDPWPYYGQGDMDTDQTMNSQKTLHSLPVRARYGVSLVRIFLQYFSEKWPRYIYIDSTAYIHRSNTSEIPLALKPRYHWSNANATCRVFHSCLGCYLHC